MIAIKKGIKHERIRYEEYYAQKSIVKKKNKLNNKRIEGEVQHKMNKHNNQQTNKQNNELHELSGTKANKNINNNNNRNKRRINKNVYKKENITAKISNLKLNKIIEKLRNNINIGLSNDKGKKKNKNKNNKKKQRTENENKKKTKINGKININNLEIEGIKLLDKQGSEILKIIGVYRTPGNITKEGTWIKTFERIIKENNKTKTKSNTIIMGDFNSHNIAWNCDRSDKNGKILINEMNKLKLDIVNDQTKTHIGEINQRNSNLDLVFASNNIIASINCKQGNDPWGSDHYPVSININYQFSKYIKKSNRVSTKKTNWDKYVKIMEEKESDLNKNEYKDLNYISKYNFIYEKIIEAVKKASEDEEEEKYKEAIPKEVNMTKNKNKKENTNEKCKEKIDSGKNNKDNKVISINKEEKNILIRVNRKGKTKNNDEKVHRKKDFRPVKWWDEECSKVIKDRKKRL